MRALFPIRDPITSVELSMVDLQTVDVVLSINLREQPPLRMTFPEAREFLTGCIADSVPIVNFSSGGAEWLDSYNKPQLIDGQGNVINRKDIV